MKKISIISAFILLARIAFSQAPAWAEQSVRDRQFPKDTYYIGYAQFSITKNDDLNKARSQITDMAKTELSSSIEITIISSTDNNVIDNMTNGKRNRLQSDFISSFRSKTTSNTQVVLNDMEKIDPVFDAKNRTYYALVYVDKSKLRLKNENLVNSNLMTLETKLANARLYQEQSKEIEALQQLGQCETIYQETENAIGQLFTLSGIFYKFDEYLAKKDAIELLANTIKSDRNLDIEESARFMVNEIQKQTGNNFKHICLTEPLSYESTVYTTRFSQRFNKEFGNQLVKSNYLVGSELTNDIKQNGYVIIKGSYEVQGNTLKIFLNLIGQPTGKVFATATGYVSKEWLEDNSIAYTPEEMNPVIERRAELKPVNTSPDVSLTVFDKPRVSETTFTFWDTLYLAVKVNKSGYLRILYLSADNTVGLMLDNYQIDASMVNKFISLDKIFRLIFCPPTYGEEDLMLAFSEKPFTKLNTRKETVTDPNGKKLEIEVITDNQVEAIQKTKGGANSPDSGGTNADTSYFTHKTLKIVLRPDKTQ